MGLGGSKENHFGLLKKAEAVLIDPHAKSSKLHEAVAWTQDAIVQCPKYPLSYMVLGKLYMRLGMYRPAADATRECLKRSPEMYSLYFMLADCLEECEEYEAAVAAISKVPRAKRAELKATHDRRKQYLVQSKPPSDGFKQQPSPLVPPPGASSAFQRTNTAVQDDDGEDDELKSVTGSVVTSGGISGTSEVSSPQNGVVLSAYTPEVPVYPPLGPAHVEDYGADSDDGAMEDWFENRHREHGAAMVRDRNHIKFRLGQRRQYNLRAVDKQRLRQTVEHRDRFARMTAGAMPRN